MAYYNICRECGCSLDPGEGTNCDDCTRGRTESEKRLACLMKDIQEDADGQMYFEDESIRRISYDWHH